MRCVTLTTDFGVADSYVAQMKGVILSICPEATIVDISHDIAHFNVLAGARVLREAAPLFPNDTVHIAVVDPGVGSSRKRLILEVECIQKGEQPKRHLYVGPDNGVLSLAAVPSQRRGIWSIDDLRLIPPYLLADTFEGRGVFAPVAAHLLKGADPSEFGERLKTSEAPSPMFELVEPRIVTAGNRIRGEIVNFDSFGNAATNIPREVADEISIEVALNGQEVPVVRCFSQIQSGKLCALWNSQGYLELVCREQSAKKEFNLRTGMGVEVVTPSIPSS